MRAWVIRRFGDPDVFEAADVDRPSPGPGEVLVRVAATSVNPIDYKIRRGDAAALAPDFPAVLHMDVSGTVEDVGEGVATFATGDVVYGCAGSLTGRPGALADYMVCDARLLAKKPQRSTFREAAALPLVTLTAWEGLRWKTQIQPGQRVLVHGATGGVGHVAPQLAKAAGAEVAVTASSEEKLRRGAELGADHCINYREESVEAYVGRLGGGEGFDLVFDTVGGEVLRQAFEAARPNGTVVSTSTRGTHDLTLMHRKGLTLHVVFMLLPMLTGSGRARHGRILKEAAQMVEEGTLRPLVDDHTFTFDDVDDAHRLAEAGDQIGKIVLTRS